MIEATNEYAELFLRAGGRLSFAEFLVLDDEQKRTFAAAGDRIVEDRLQRLLVTLDEGIGGALEQAAVDRALHSVVEKAASKLEVRG